MTTYSRRSVFGLLLLALVGCGDATGPRETFLATIETEIPELPISIAVPRIVESGTPFIVQVATCINKFCEELGPTQVEVEGLRAVVVPLDRRVSINCPDIGSSFGGTHTASLQFETGGTGTLIVRGWSDLADDAIEVEHVIQVVNLGR